MKYTKIPENTFKNIQLNAGVLVSDFNPKESTISEENMLGATSGGVSFTATPTYTDYGEDIDNCPVNVKELKKLDSWEITMSGTFITVDTDLAKLLIGAADIDGKDATKIVPRNDVKVSDFGDIWWVGDYSDINEDEKAVEAGTDGSAGCIAIHMMNTLSTGGFQVASSNRAKGQFAFEFTAHYSMNEQDTVPFEVYVASGKAAIPG